MRLIEFVLLLEIISICSLDKVCRYSSVGRATDL